MKTDQLKTGTPDRLDVRFSRSVAQEKCDREKPPPFEGEIPRKLRELFIATEILSEKTAQLGQRLQTVMVTHPESEDNSLAVPYATEMGGALSQLQARINLMIDAVASMDARLEL